MRFRGKSAVVTGASAGIGRAIAERFLKEGSAVLIAGRTEDTLRAATRDMKRSIRDAQKRIVSFCADASDPSQAELTIRKALEQFGQVDILVNNIGLLARKFISEVTAADFERDFNLNVRSAIAHTQAILPFMLRARAGVIIHIASVASCLPVPDCSLYSPAKAALVMHARTLASEVARYSVRVNCVSPGPIDTAIFEKMLGGNASRLKAELRKRIPLQRLGRPEEVASAVAFLASDEASWITGINLIVDGGRTAFSNVADAFSTALPFGTGGEDAAST